MNVSTSETTDVYIYICSEPGKEACVYYTPGIGKIVPRK